MQTKTQYILNLYLNEEYGTLTLYAFIDDGDQIGDVIEDRFDLDLFDDGPNEDITWQTVNFLLRTEGLTKDNLWDNYGVIDEWLSVDQFKKPDTPAALLEWLNKLEEGDNN